MLHKYMPELTLDQLNALITAADTRMRETRDLYEKCKDAKLNYPAETQRLLNKYLLLKTAKIQLENAALVNMETTRFELL